MRDLTEAYVDFNKGNVSDPTSLVASHISSRSRRPPIERLQLAMLFQGAVAAAV